MWSVLSWGKCEVDTRWIDTKVWKVSLEGSLISELRLEVWWNLLGKGSGGESFLSPGYNTGQRRHVYSREWQVCVSLKLMWVKESTLHSDFKHHPLPTPLPISILDSGLSWGEGRSFKMNGNWTFWFRLDSTFKNDFLYFYERNVLKEQ